VGLILLVWPGLRWRWRFAAFAGFAAAFALLNLTLGRGAWLSFAAGLAGAVVLLFQWRKWTHWLVAAALAGMMLGAFVMLPQSQKERFQRLYATLTAPAPADGEETAARPPDGNIQRRLVAFETAWRVIKTHPIAGAGYGYHNYAAVAKQYRPDWGTEGEIESELYQSHSHNNLLEVAAEMGWPGLAAYLGLHGSLFLLLAAATRRAHRCGWKSRWPLAFALALFLMCHCYGMTNYSLRYVIGDYFWLLMGMLAILAATADEDEPAECSTA
jgi:O-antigen ligase